MTLAAMVMATPSDRVTARLYQVYSRSRLLLASSYPYQSIFAQVSKAFSTG